MIGRFMWGAVLAIAMVVAPAGHAVQAGAVRVTALGAPVVTAGNGTVMLRGSLRTSLMLTLHGAFSVGHARTLSWDLLRATSMTVEGYSETVTSERFTFNIQPQSFQDLTEGGVSVRRFTWSDPPPNTVIRATVQRSLRIHSTLTALHGTGAYPLSAVSQDVRPYLQITPSLQLSPSQRSFVRGLVGHRRSERTVVNRVANWVASHLHYDGSLAGGPFDASWVISNKRATCQGYASVMAGMLRALGIPAQVVYGWISSTPLTVRSGGSYQTVSWAPGTSGAFHDWLNVYFPGSGWVAFDPQREKFFVDTRHIALLTEADASNPVLGQWLADPIGNESATGRPLSTGGTEAVPEDGSLAAQVSEQDVTRLRVASVVHDVHAIVLFAR